MTSIAIATLLGVTTWSLAEYCIHRWLGHDRRFSGNLFEVEHTAHHSRGHYFAPWWKKAMTAALASAVIFILAVLAVPAHIALAYTSGFVGFYISYEVLHRLEHVWEGVGPYARWARRHHFHHHFHAPQKNHGVTSPLWDLVFGTYEKPQTIAVPEKLQMPWLCDPSGEVRAHLARNYRLRRLRR